MVREFVMFILINGIGIGISTGFTALAKYSLRHHRTRTCCSLAGVVGILVATVVRFFAYRFLVFNKELDEEPAFSHDHEIIEQHHRDKPAAVPSAVADGSVRDRPPASGRPSLPESRQA